KSSRQEEGTTLISPDLAVCPDCLREMNHPADKRFNYPFINCTNCGPRYSIIRSLPYDRPGTSMLKFLLCDYCEGEYVDPLNRRFHAQPVACSDCGPHLEFMTNDLKPAPGDPIKNTVSALLSGKIVGIKGIGGFHLACDARNEEAVKILRERKIRPHKPFAVMCLPEYINKLVSTTETQLQKLSSASAPIMILPKINDHPLSGLVAPLNPYLGIFFPYAPHHYQILTKDLPFLVMTSGNINNEPIASEETELVEICDFFLTHNRPILNRCDDSILMPSNNKDIMIRRSRGYIPSPIDVNTDLIPSLGCGAGLKLTFALGNEKRIYLSPYIGNDNNKRTFDFYTETAEKYKQWFKIEPELYACDLQPDFLTTRYAESFNKPVIQVQHHHAHIAAVIGEHNIEGPVLGVSYDGTGLGDDGAIWGGEIMIADLDNYKREYYLEYMPLPGGDAAIRHPARIAYAYALHTCPESSEMIKLDQLDKTIIKKQLNSNFNLFQTSSMGRLFDCVAALLGLYPSITFEAQSAMALQFLCGTNELETTDPYEINFDEKVIKVDSIVQAVIDDIKHNVPHQVIAQKFHRTVVELTVSTLINLRKRSRISKVVLSGGVMQNRIILDGLSSRLEKNNFTVFRPELIPPNDGSVSFGQILVANSIIKR
ncbi:carbamoyltransferase HypF, partial [Candidatus Cloacimonadota bacterium]